MVHKDFVSLRRHSKVNAWLLYKRHCMQLETPKRKQKSLLKFISEISHSLLHRNTIPTAKIGRPSKRMSTDNNTQPEHKKRAASNSQPDSDVRLDCVAHWPEFRKEKRKCRYCKTGQSCLLYEIQCLSLSKWSKKLFCRVSCINPPNI